LARPIMGWWFSESTQPGSFFKEPKKFELGPAHHGLTGYTGWLTDSLN